MTLRNPGIALRALVLAAQGVFYNIFCTFSPLLLYKFECSRSSSNQVLSYIISPRTCHRFVGYLEEEAVVTYTHAIEELERGHLPIWYAHLGHALCRTRCTVIYLEQTGKRWQRPPSPRTTGVFLKTRRSRTSSTPCARMKAHTASSTTVSATSNLMTLTHSRCASLTCM
jgi:hypothetical protein